MNIAVCRAAAARGAAEISSRTHTVVSISQQGAADEERRDLLAPSQEDPVGLGLGSLRRSPTGAVASSLSVVIKIERIDTGSGRVALAELTVSRYSILTVMINCQKYPSRGGILPQEGHDEAKRIGSAQRGNSTPSSILLCPAKRAACKSLSAHGANRPKISGMNFVKVVEWLSSGTS